MKNIKDIQQKARNEALKHRAGVAPITQEQLDKLDTIITQTAKAVYEDVLENGLPERRDELTIPREDICYMRRGNNLARNHTKQYIYKQISNLSE